MKLSRLSLFVIAFLCVLLFSCKQDAPIYPDDPDFVAYGGKQNGGNGDATGTVDIAYLTADWETTETYMEIYSSNGNTISSIKSEIPIFIAANLNNANKTFTIEGGILVNGGTFTITGSGTNTILQLSEDPFNRLSNGPIRIANLTSTSMTWMVDGLSPDPLIKSRYRIIFKKRP